MGDSEVFLKNLTSSSSTGDIVEIPEEARLLLDELYELDDLSAEDWKEVYEHLVRKLTELHDPYEVLAVIYKAIEVRSDFIIANRVVGKFMQHFYLIFEKLPGRPRAYFIPSAAGRWLFESLVNPLERQEVKARVEKHLAAVQQLSLMSFINSPGRGVRV